MLYADIRVKEPIDKIADDWNYLQENVIQKFAGFRPVGDNIYGARTVTLDKPSDIEGAKGAFNLVKTRRNFEIGPKGVIQVPRVPLGVHINVAGTPHRTEFLFGYWHINDKDEIIVTLPPPEPHLPSYLVIVMGFPQEGETDRMAWYCEQCTNLVFMREHHTGRVGFNTFWRWERAAVTEYNSDARNRTCPECGHVNEIGYCAFAARDTPEERQARTVW